MNEAEFLPQTMQCIQNQQRLESGIAIHTWVCVNQPESYHNDPTKKHICQNNATSLAYLNELQWENLHIIDRSSLGKGWTGKDHGVGMARKTLMDSINDLAQENDIIVSLDADTEIGPAYLQSVASVFQTHPTAVALSNPYYHRLTGDKTLDRAMLRYEIYMRYYAINMWRIKSPYNFTALGSAIALPVWSYRKIGGMTAKKSGEDFYLLQKLRKSGTIITYNREKVYPGTRYSDRVFFGTGPALIKGSQGSWESYPIYDDQLFDQVLHTYNSFPALYGQTVQTPMDKFLKAQFRDEDVFEALRNNATSQKQFIKACHHKIDGLRVLQFLKASQLLTKWSDEENLKRFLYAHHPNVCHDLSSWDDHAWGSLNFATSGMALLEKIRTFLMNIESIYQRNDPNQNPSLDCHHRPNSHWEDKTGSSGCSSH